MNVLIVHAHPEPKSFNGALTRAAAEALREQGHSLEVSDLYAMKWKPVADADDYAGPREDQDYLRIDREQTFTHQAGTTACDIATEQAKVSRADLVLFQYPMWWFGPPAILKGWFDRVFTRGFAYLPGRKYDTGLMAGKLAMVSVTTGTSAGTYAPDGIDGAILDILWPVHRPEGQPPVRDGLRSSRTSCTSATSASGSSSVESAAHCPIAAAVFPTRSPRA